MQMDGGKLFLVAACMTSGLRPAEGAGPPALRGRNARVKMPGCLVSPISDLAVMSPSMHGPSNLRGYMPAHDCSSSANFFDLAQVGSRQEIRLFPYNVIAKVDYADHSKATFYSNFGYFRS